MSNRSIPVPSSQPVPSVPPLLNIVPENSKPKPLVMHCELPQPWTCNPSELTQATYMDPFGCKHPDQTYDSRTGLCCSKK